jgi:hypothetical protein
MGKFRLKGLPRMSYTSILRALPVLTLLRNSKTHHYCMSTSRVRKPKYGKAKEFVQGYPTQVADPRLNPDNVSTWAVLS